MDSTTTNNSETDAQKEETCKKQPANAGLKWFLIGGCITALVALCGVTVLGVVLAAQWNRVVESPQPMAQAATATSGISQVTETPLSTHTLNPDLPAPTITAKPFPTNPPAPVGNPAPDFGFEYGNPNLHASNPGNFAAAAGKPQMVELFAFW